MILSGSKARRIVSNYEVLRAVPELQRPVESNRMQENLYKTKGRCAKGCDDATFFSGVEKEALDAIVALSPDAMGRLAGFLGEKEILSYVSIPGKKPQYKQLFPVKAA